MTAQLIDRPQVKSQMKDLLRTAQIGPKGFVALYAGIILLLNLVDALAGGTAPTVAERNLLGLFVYVLVMLLSAVLGAGFVLYCLAIRRGERAEFLTLFDGFSMVGKLITLNIVIFFFVFLWSLLFVIPGFIAAYRYRFALYNLYENPQLGVLEALEMSKRQTLGYKAQLFTLDLSYIGWSILANLPAHLYTAYATYSVYASAAPAMPPSLSLVLGVRVVCGLWSLVTLMFYLPTYQCTELAYFDIAKQTSGVGLGMEPPTPDAGPDGLGGF